MMAEPLPKFDAPPVVETAMSVQFVRLQPFPTAIVGWFWKEFLPSLPGDARWEKAVDAPRLEDSFERFGDQEKWGRLGFRMSTSPEPNRVQISRSDNERMIQVQDSRFVLNWMKQSDAAYPSFRQLSKEFWELFPIFETFAAKAECGPVEQNQWELSYINHIAKDDLWQSTNEWANVIPGLSFPSAVVAEPTAEPTSLDWRFNFPNERGRLQVNIQNVKKDPTSDNLMQLVLTARGSINQERGWDLRSGFDLGHEAIVRSFAAMTSSKAQKLWKRRQ
jgi:uncharacterized protein (TIGR04255 family)